MRHGAVYWVLACNVLASCCGIDGPGSNGSRTNGFGTVAAGDGRDFTIYDGPSQATYRVCYDGPGSVEVKSDTGKVAVLTAGQERSGDHLSCTDMRALNITVKANNGHGAIHYGLIDGVRQ